MTANAKTGFAGKAFAIFSLPTAYPPPTNLANTSSHRKRATEIEAQKTRQKIEPQKNKAKKYEAQKTLCRKRAAENEAQKTS